MKHAILTAILIAIAAHYACSKIIDEPEGSHLLVVSTERSVRMGQAVRVYDFNTDANTIYKWTIAPAGNSATLSEQYRKGNALISFGHPGHYRISAAIYDSSGNRLAAQTNAVDIDVSNDSLHARQPLNIHDELSIATTANARFDGSSWHGYAFLFFSTQKTYEYYNNTIVYTDQSRDGQLSFHFSDSINLSSYPFALGHGVWQPATAAIALPNFPTEKKVPLSITWLGKAYHGSLTLHKSGRYEYEWKKDALVKLQ